MSRLASVRGSNNLKLLWVVPGVLLFCLEACSPRPTAIAAATSDNVTLTIGFPFPSAGQDPLHGVAQAARLASLEGLGTQNPDGHAVPRLAKSWTEASDGLSWTISLRPEAVFHDGTPVNSAAVKESLQRYLESPASRYSPGLQDISGIDQAGEYELTIRLLRPSSFLIDDLDCPITKLDSTGSVLGTGPYVITSTSTNEVVMNVFPKYYRGESSIQRIVWRLFPTVRTAWAAAMRGEVDFLYEVGPESREFLESEGSIALYSFLRAYVYGVVFNFRRPLFKSAEVRRALNYAVDRKTIVERGFKNHATIASGPAWPLHWAFDSSAPSYVYDSARAAASLDKIFGPSEALQRRKLQFTCLIPENFQLWERLALIVQRNLAEIGVDMKLEAVPFDTFNERLKKGNFDAALMEFVSGHSPSRPFFFWRSSGQANFSRYHNTSLDAALDGIRNARNDPDYRRAFQQFQQATFDDPPAIFLAWGETARAVNRRFDVIRAPGGDIRMTISDWKLAQPLTRVAN